MSFNLTTQGKIMAKAGAGVNSALSGSAIVSAFCDDSESEFCALTKRDWLTLSGSTLTNFQGAISDAVSSRAAMKCISYDMSGYTSRMEAQTMLDVNRDIWDRIVTALTDDKYKLNAINGV